MSKRLNKKTTIPKPLTSSLETDLKHDWDARDERYWVNKVSFGNFLMSTTNYKMVSKTQYLLNCILLLK